MKDTLISKLGSFQATLGVADKTENKSIWENKSPLAFSEGLVAARAAVAGLVKAGAEQSADIRGSTDGLRDLRALFEKALHPLARGAFRCLKNMGSVEEAAKVDITPSDLHNARAMELASLGETILELAEPLTKGTSGGQPVPGEKYGVTAARLNAVDALWSRYSIAVGAPASARAGRKALTGALPSQFAKVEEQFAELDDLIVQFRGVPAGEQFVDAWFNARRVLDTGRRATRPVTSTPVNVPAAKAA